MEYILRSIGLQKAYIALYESKLKSAAMEFQRKGREIATKDGNQDSIFLPEELVTQILLGLDIRGLFRSKLVSKQWNSIISHPKFRHCYLQRATSSPKSSSKWHLWGITSECYLSESRCTTLDIVASSSGLILSHSSRQYLFRWELQWKDELHVINPLTKQSAKLPISSWSLLLNCILLAFATRPVQPGGDHQAYNITYKVVVIKKPWQHQLRAAISSGITSLIFSSDTGRWTTHRNLTSCPESVRHCTLNSSEIFSYNGILHLLDRHTRSIVTYDPYNSPDTFGSIQLPSTGSANILQNSEMNVFHFWHEDVIKFGEIEHCDDHVRRLCLWQLVDHAKGEWRLEQRCLISPLWEDNILKQVRILVAPDPCNGELLCLFLRCGNIRKAFDLGSAKEVFVDPSMSRTIETYSSVNVAQDCHPIALCPWSSPFYVAAARISNFPSSTEGFEMIPNVWFPSVTKFV